MLKKPEKSYYEYNPQIYNFDSKWEDYHQQELARKDAEHKQELRLVLERLKIFIKNESGKSGRNEILERIDKELERIK